MSRTKTTQRILKLAAGIAMFIGLIAIVPDLAWAADITSCLVLIDQPGDYHLAQDLTCNTREAAIRIIANDVTLHLDGHTLSGGGTGTGIIVGPGAPVVSGVTIQGGTVTNFRFDVILINGVSDSKIVNVDAENTVATPPGNAITVQFSDNNSIINCTASGSSFAGINLIAANDNTVISNTVNNNAMFGIVIQLLGGSSAANNIVRANSVQNNGQLGIAIGLGATANLIQANKVFGHSPFDLFDLNPSCDNNVWKSNKNGSANQACIQ